MRDISPDASPAGHRVLVTGATGFIGRDLVRRLSADGWIVRAAGRKISSATAGSGVENVTLPDLSGPCDWQPLLDGVNHVVHLAGIAHATSTIPEATYLAVNGDAVGALARAARAAGVKRVVMMSSIRAQCGPNAEGVVDEARAAAPVDAYGRAKLEGERQLQEALSGGATSGVALRPVLVYGPGVKGNMGALLRIARSPLPLPLGALSARRSLLGLVNLHAAVSHALTADSVSGGTYLLADDGALTVPEIIAAMRAGMSRRAGLVSIPMAPVKWLATASGRASAWQRIAGDLVVSTAALQATGWRPVETAREGIARWIVGD